MTGRHVHRFGAAGIDEKPEAMVDPDDAIVMLLSQAHTLPPGTRKKISIGLAQFSPPSGQKDEPAFYSWLRSHYVTYGTANVDELLERSGGNDARRSLRQMVLDWGSRKLHARGLPYTRNPARMAGFARANGLDDVLAMLEFVRGLPATAAMPIPPTGSSSSTADAADGQEDPAMTLDPTGRSDDPGRDPVAVDSVPVAHERSAIATDTVAATDASFETNEPSNDLPAEAVVDRIPEGAAIAGVPSAEAPTSQAVLDDARRVLDRLHGNPLPSALSKLREVMLVIATELDEADIASRLVVEAAARRASATTALVRTLASISDSRRAMLGDVGIGADAPLDLLEAAHLAAAALVAAEEEATSASERVADIVRVGPERRAAVLAEQKASMEAEEQLEKVAQALDGLREETSASPVLGAGESFEPVITPPDVDSPHAAPVPTGGSTDADASESPVRPGSDDPQITLDISEPPFASSTDPQNVRLVETEAAATAASSSTTDDAGHAKPSESPSGDSAADWGDPSEDDGYPEVVDDGLTAFDWSEPGSPDSVEPPEQMRDVALSAWDERIGRSLDAGLLGLAVHLADGRDIAGATVLPHSWPVVVLESALVSRSIESHADSAAGRYAELSASLIEVAAHPGAEDRSDGTGEALLAGALRASLVAPYAGARVVAELRRWGTLSAYRRLMDFADRAPQLNISTVRDLSPMSDVREREAQHRNARDELERWYRSARSRTLAYQPATAMWQRELIVPNGKIGRPVEAILRNEEGARTLALDIAEELRDRPGQLLDDAFDAQLSKSRAVRLEAAARERCLGLLDETRELIEAWLATQPTGRESRDRLEASRAELAVGLKEAADDLVRALAVGGREGQGAVLLKEAVRDLNAIIDGVASPPNSAVRTLDAEIALLPDFPLNGRHRLRIGVDDVDPLRLASESAFEERLPSWRASFERALETGAATVAQRVLPLLTDRKDEDEHRLEAMRILQRRDLESRRASLRNRLDDLQMASTGSDESGGMLTDFEAVLVSLGEEPLNEFPLENVGAEGAICDFPVLRARLEAFEADLEEQRSVVAVRLEERIAEAEEKFSVELVECRSLLAGGDLGTLVEDLLQLQSHRPGEPSVRHRHLIRPLRHFVDDVLNMDPPSVTVLHDCALNGRPHGPLQYGTLHASEHEVAARLLEAWIAFKRTAQSLKPALEQTLIGLLTVLGFGGAKVVRQQKWRGGYRYDVATDPLRSAANCMIPTFGSQADGNYTILVIPEGAMERCLQGFDELPAEVLVFSAEWLNPNARQIFLRTARERPGASVALLDEATIAALSATSGRGLRQFFDLAVPFGAAHPYVDTSLADAAPSIEMFFGREREYEQLFDPQGSCLVYGGRQLGKTALLKQIHMRNVANPDLVVIYLSIENLGRSVQSSEVWNHLSQQLYERDVLTTLARGEHAVCAGIRQWLAGGPTRRLLMLLDEADNFLEHEINTEFAIIGIMRRLMEETGRRAKFVYAGLHNVQRFVRTPNSPMLHLGNAVQIGPLLGHDRDAARRMVFDPMAAIGIGFEHAADAHHILSLVGYYPSLVQTFGKTIVARAGDDLKREETLRLPRVLTREDIIESFQDTEFRKALIGKFRATLQLDRRYELITYAVCFRVEEDRRNRVGNAGYTEAEIRRYALEYWPQGFAATNSADVFEALLDEMVGLGVLNRDGDRFTLRSARIAAMLGGSEQIFDQLVQFSDKPPEHKSDPMANHRSLSQSGTYAPLSLRQEKALVDHLRHPGSGASMILIAGSAAVANLEQLAESVSGLIEVQEWAPPRLLAFRSLDDLRKVISGARKDAREGRPRVILCQGRWPDAEEASILSKMRELKDASHPVRLVFLADEREVIRAERSGDAAAIAATGAMIVDVRPWDREAIHHWLTRIANTPENDLGLAERVWEASGGYPGVLTGIRRMDRLSDDDIVQSVKAAAAKVARPAFLGFADPSLSAFIDLLMVYGEQFSENDLLEAAKEIDHADPEALVRISLRLGLLREVQRSGPARFGFSEPVRASRTRATASA